MHLLVLSSLLAAVACGEPRPAAGAAERGAGTSGVATGTNGGSGVARAATSTTSPPARALVAPVPPPLPVPVAPPGEPELPRAAVNFAEAAMPSSGDTVRVASLGAFQAALRSAVGGRTILLPAGAVWTGNVVVSKPAGASAGAWLTIATELPTAALARDVRVTPSGSGARLARILTPNAQPAIRTAAGVGGGYYVRFRDVAAGVAPGNAAVTAVVALGTSERARQPSLAATPSHLVLDHVLVDLPATVDARRCVAIDAAWVGVVDSWLDGCHSNQGDAQAILGINGAQVVTIDNTLLGGSGENVMFGGGDAAASDMQPGDITLRRSYLVKARGWRRASAGGVGPYWTTKNLFELKNARRVLVEDVVMEHAWADAQNGEALALKSVNQDGRAPWAGTSDVTVRYARFTDVGSTANVAGRPEGNPADTLQRVLIEQTWTSSYDPGAVGYQLIVGSGAKAVTFRHNTTAPGGKAAAVYFANGFAPGLSVTGNAFGSGGTYHWGYASAEGHGTGRQALDFHVPRWTPGSGGSSSGSARVIGGNCFAGGVDAGAATPADAFAATLGGCPPHSGADIAEITRRTAGAVSGDWTAARAGSSPAARTKAAPASRRR